MSLKRDNTVKKLDKVVEKRNLHLGTNKRVCLICNHKFSHAGYLKRHLQRTHYPKIENRAVCEHCGKKFKCNKIPPKHHISCGRFSDSEHMCEYCGKKLSSRTGYLRHKIAHTGKLPFSCADCGKSFNAKQKLKVHTRVHTGEKPFVCKFCDRCFAKRNTLGDHLRTHTKEKPFNCDVCSKSFAQRSTLGNHRKMHFSNKPYKCRKCSEFFPTRVLLSGHDCLEEKYTANPVWPIT